MAFEISGWNFMADHSISTAPQEAAQSGSPGDQKSAPLKLHLGCGAKYIPGFFHIDALGYPHVDRKGFVDRLDFLRNNSVALIYASHVLEHFGRNEVDYVLREWHRVLQPGGILRLGVPDFAACARLYVEGKLAHGINDIMGLLIGGQRDGNDFHRIIFDRPTLEARLKVAGFSHCRLWDWRVTEHSQTDDYSQAYLPHMDKESGTLVSLNIEAIK
jgi:SAM-dependent methyltransferase